MNDRGGAYAWRLEMGSRTGSVSWGVCPDTTAVSEQLQGDLSCKIGTLRLTFLGSFYLHFV